MADFKLPKLPDRTPFKLTIVLTPELKQTLDAYAAAYEAAYGRAESVTELIPFMLASFLENDRAFSRSQRGNSGAA
jgi:hypothetical protein